MLRILISVGCLFILSLVACSRNPEPKDLVATWTGSNGSTLELHADDKFSAKNVPIDAFLNPDGKGGAISGSGDWKLVKGNVYWEIKLEFSEMMGKVSRTEITMFVSGIGNSVSLFQWKEEEGGDRYELRKLHPSTP